MNCQSILKYLKGLGATHCQVISSHLLVPEERIRKYCYENKCGCYNKHLSCPPYTGTVSEVKKKLNAFKSGILIQYSQNLNVQNDKEGLKRTKLKLHNIVLEAETYGKENMGVNTIWGFIGGNCELCDECAGYRNEACTYPEKARVSMEAIAIDVVNLLRMLHLDTEFRNDKITWTGIVLFDREIGALVDSHESKKYSPL